MSSRDYLKHVVSTSEPTNSALGDEYYNPSSNKLLKRLAVNGTSVNFVPILLNPSPDSTPVVITSEGKVGIGTNAPEGSLHIKRQDTVSFTEIHTDFIIENPGLGNARIFLKTLANNRNWEFFADDSDGTFGIYDGVGVARRFTIMPDGNIGIGASSPIAKLDVNAASGYVDARVRSGSNQTYIAADGTASYFGTYSNIPVILSTNNINRGGISNAGVWSLGAPAGSESLRVTPVASSVNYLNVYGAATNTQVNMRAEGSDTNIGINMTTKGTGSHDFYTSNYGGIQFRITNTASAVNYLQITGSASVYPVLSAQGSGANVAVLVTSKGTEGVYLQTGSTNQLVIAHTASAVNYLQVTGAITSGVPAIYAQGSDANISIGYSSKGVAAHYFYTRGLTSLGFSITDVASTVNYLQASGNSTGSAPTLTAVGSDTNIGIVLTPKGTGGVVFPAGANTTPSITTSGDTNTGIFFPAADTIAFTEGGVEAMRINSSGNVGIGTSSPGAALHVAGVIASAPTGNGVFLGTDGNYGAIQLNGSTGSYIDFSTSGTDFRGRIIYDNSINAMYFYANTAESMRISANSDVFIGTTTNPLPPNSVGRLNILSTTGDGINLKHTVNGYNTLNIWQTGTTTFNAVCFYKGDTQTSVGTISVSTTATAYNTSSDYRLKENVTSMTGALAKIAQLKPVTYTWKSNGSQGQGFIAHELQEVVPDAVTGEKDEVYSNGNPKYQGVDTSFLVATLVAAIQEQQVLIAQLQSDVAMLKDNNG
jgi:hypothetical protein